MHNIIGIDIGGTKTSVFVATDIPSVLEKEIFATSDPEMTIKNILNIIDKYIKKYKNIEAVGISCGDPISAEEGIIMSPPNLIGWDNIHICNIISSHTKITNVFLENDANGCALAEFLWGAGKGSEHMCFITCGTGFGAGLILNGQLYRGASGSAGEVGHIRLSNDGPIGYNKKGSFEGFCSGGGISRLALNIIEKNRNREDVLEFTQKYLKDNDITTKLLSEAAIENNKFALSVFDNSAKYLGRGLAIVIDILNLERIIIGGVYAKMEKYFYDTMIEVLKDECLSSTFNAVKILKPHFGGNIGDYGTIAIALKSNTKNV